MKIDLDNNELNITDVQFNFARMSGDVATLTIGLDIPVGWTEGEPIVPEFPEGFGHLEYVEFWQAGGKLMAGYVTEIKPMPVGRAWDVSYTISSVLALLSSIPYVPESTLEQLVDAHDAVAAVLAHARAHSGLDFSYDVGALSASKVVAVTATTTCGEALQTLLDWCPNCRVAMRYDASADTLVVGGSPPVCCYDLRDGSLLDGDGVLLGTSEGAEGVDIAARYDLQHPCVSVLHGPFKESYGDSARKYSPFSLMYDLPYSAVSTSENEGEALGSAAVASMRQKEVVTGVLVPRDHSYESNHMLSSGSAAQLAFWRAIDCPWQIRKVGGSSNLKWGGFHINPLEGGEAYPPADESDPDAPSTVPWNYQSCANWLNVYLHTSGSFLAHVDSEHCTRGLKFCRASCEQNIYCKDSDAVAGLTLEQRNEWLAGEFTKAGVKYRYTTVKIEGIFINRARKSYYPLTNELDPSDGDYEAPEEPEGGDGSGSGASGVSWDDVKLGAQQYYAATRKLYYDGSLSLVDFVGNPSSLISSTLSVIGGLPDWAGMASPITGLSYSPLGRSLGITIGVSEILSINEYADRMATTKRLMYGSMAGSLAAEPEEPGDGGGGSSPEPEADDDGNGVASIAASYSCNYCTATTATKRKPFEVYAEGDTWYIEGGLLPSPKGLVDVERKVIAGYDNTFRYGIRLARSGAGYEGRLVKVPK